MIQFIDLLCELQNVNNMDSGYFIIKLSFGIPKMKLVELCRNRFILCMQVLQLQKELQSMPQSVHTRLWHTLRCNV